MSFIGAQTARAGLPNRPYISIGQAIGLYLQEDANLHQMVEL